MPDLNAPTLDQIRDVLNEAAASEDLLCYSNYDNTAEVMRWLAANIDGLMADRARVAELETQLAHRPRGGGSDGMNMVQGMGLR